MRRRYRYGERERANRLFFVHLTLGKRGSLLAQVRANDCHEARRQGLTKAYAEVSAEARKDVRVLGVK